MTVAEEGGPLGTATAPGKVILLGEHAVVYGQPALAIPVAAVEARATVWPAEGPLTIHAHYPRREGGEEHSVVVADASAADALATAVRAALGPAPSDALPRWSIEVASTVPTGRGMGSSAAIAVALARAVRRAMGEGASDEEIAALALAAERVTHGTPSGIDNTVVALECPIRFHAGRATRLTLPEPLMLLIADSGLPSATADMVAGVRRRREQQPAAHAHWFAQIARLVDDAAAAIARGEAIRLGRLMNTNHLVLQALRVSVPAVDLLVSAAREAGALGAKLSGAGGGGVVIALVTPDTATEVSRALLDAGAEKVLRSVIETTT